MKARAKRGAKPRAGKAATEWLKLRVTADELEAYRAAAGREALDLSAWVREACGRMTRVATDAE